MKVQELRELLKKADREKLEKAFVECYKQFPKAKKEEIDVLIDAVFSGEDVKKRVSETPADFEALKAEIERFLENAYAQNYLAPNRIVPKSQRPKWRFMVKGYIKEFLKIKAGDPHYPDMIILFEKLYRMLCYACCYYLFSTEDPFRSIGWEQQELFQVLAKKVFEDGYTEEAISKMVALAVCDGVSRENLSIEQAYVLAAELKTSDMKHAAMQEIKEQVKTQEERLATTKKGSDRIFWIEDTINDLCNMLLILSIKLSETEKCLPYYFSHARERDREIILYRALRVAYWTEKDDSALWIDIYHYGLTKKIHPRESLVVEYQKRLDRLNG